MSTAAATLLGMHVVVSAFAVERLDLGQDAADVPSRHLVGHHLVVQVLQLVNEPGLRLHEEVEALRVDAEVAQREEHDPARGRAGLRHGQLEELPWCFVGAQAATELIRVADEVPERPTSV
ncbi:hypothetical protein ON010_g15692 [Phytophthora cinnamomi]|nr:hypothetical protein ON010_g15692 [Phytophthora cinnamomi]